jgi:hypothetical protein
MCVCTKASKPLARSRPIPTTQYVVLVSVSAGNGAAVALFHTSAKPMAPTGWRRLQARIARHPVAPISSQLRRPARKTSCMLERECGEMRCRCLRCVTKSSSFTLVSAICWSGGCASVFTTAVNGLTLGRSRKSPSVVHWSRPDFVRLSGVLFHCKYQPLHI